eukprot:Partr_v1_DN27141_c0_g2_i5_m15773 putative phosphotransferase 1
MYIDPEKLPNLKLYKYSAVDKSQLSKYVLQPYWTWLVTWFPLTIAPNLITLMGFLCICANTATLIYYSPDLTTPCPNWCYFTFAAGLFIYQSLDAIDGKQARRTNSSSPLGQLFDHGCDALNTTLGVILSASALNMGASWLAVFSLLVSIGNFYISTWEEFYTGTLYLGYFSGPTEGVVAVIGVYTMTGFVGPLFWSQSANSLFGLPQWMPQLMLNEFMIYSTSTLLLHVFASSFHSVYVKCRADNKSYLQALLGLLPFVYFAGVLCLWLHNSPQLMSANMVAVLLFVCFAFGNIVGRMIVDHVVHEEFPYFNPNLALMTAGLIMSRFGILAGPVEILYLYACISISLFLHAHFCVDVIDQICEYLDINCLTLKFPVAKAPAPSGRVTRSSRRKAE